MTRQELQALEVAYELAGARTICFLCNLSGDHTHYGAGRCTSRISDMSVRRCACTAGSRKEKLRA